MDRFCLECNILLKGRTDKKFCDDQCRSNYNHRLKVNDHSFINSVNQILKKNRKILKTQNPSIKVKRDALLSKGFDFNFHTHTYVTKKENVYIFCYEYGYMALENEELLLVKREAK